MIVTCIESWEVAGVFFPRSSRYVLRDGAVSSQWTKQQQPWRKKKAGKSNTSQHRAMEKKSTTHTPVTDKKHFYRGGNVLLKDIQCIHSMYLHSIFK